MSRKFKDLLTRVWRTFLQGAIGAFVLTYASPLFHLAQDFASLGPGDHLPATPDLTFWRNLLLAMFAGGVIACVSLAHNLMNDYLGWGNGTPVLGKPVDRAVGDAMLHENP